MKAELDNAEYWFLKQKALDILSRRDHSTQELVQKLQLAIQRKRRVTPQLNEQRYLDNIAAVVNWGLAQGLLNDPVFIERYTVSRARQGYGPQRIYHDLIAKGSPREEVETYLQDVEIDWQELAQQVATKKIGTIRRINYKQQVKLQSFLYYRGFNREQIHAVMKNFINEA